MLMPELLYALGRTSRNSKWLGDILRAACGQTVKLDESQKAVVAVVMEAFAEQEERRSVWRERKARERAGKERAR